MAPTKPELYLLSLNGNKLKTYTELKPYTRFSRIIFSHIIQLSWRRIFALCILARPGRRDLTRKEMACEALFQDIQDMPSPSLFLIRMTPVMSLIVIVSL